MASMSFSFIPAKAAGWLGLDMVHPTEARPMPVFAAARSLFVALAGFAIGLVLAAMALPLAARAAPPPATPAPAAADMSPEAKAAAAASGNPIAMAEASDTKTISIIVYGSDPCPAGKGDEIVVCAREPESERYRIPKRFRGKKVQPAPGNAWANKVRASEDDSRRAAGLPDTCSAVGTGGQSGCFAQFQRQMYLQRQQQKQADATNPTDVPQH
jgi:hypothetical protein